MSIRNTLRSLPWMMQASFAEAIAYRAEMLVWILSTTMPLVMMVLWSAVAKDAPVGRFGESDFVLYFLTTFIVRQLTSAWTAWQMSFEVRQGQLSQRLLRPINVIMAYAVENLAALPMRMALALPVAVIGLVILGADRFPRSAGVWLLVGVSLVGAWLISFLANSIIGCLSFYLESSTKVMELWLTMFMVFSGYLIPVELFPEGLRQLSNVLPFRYQIGLPVELISGGYTWETGGAMLLRQWAWVGALLLGTWAIWTRGVRRFAAYGG
jgi:ABC-2 type transport system permease protein